MENLANLSQTAMKICYQICCLAFCAFVIHLIVDQFLGNKDSSEVSYKKFTIEEDEKIEYPTFSVCAQGVNGAIFEQLVYTEIYDKLYKHPECTKPGVTHRGCEIGLYQKMLLGKIDPLPEVSSQDIDQITETLLSDIEIERFKFLDGNGGWIHYDKKSLNLFDK